MECSLACIVAVISHCFHMYMYIQYVYRMELLLTTRRRLFFCLLSVLLLRLNESTEWKIILDILIVIAMHSTLRNPIRAEKLDVFQFVYIHKIFSNCMLKKICIQLLKNVKKKYVHKICNNICRNHYIFAYFGLEAISVSGILLWWMNIENM